MERSYLHLPTRLALIKPDGGIPYIRKQHINDIENDSGKNTKDNSKGKVILLLKPRR